MESIASRVRALREENGWSQAELATRVGIRSQSIYRIEAGASKASGTTLEALVRVLGVAVLGVAVHTSNVPGVDAGGEG